ncbi:TolC family protein [Carboxylicivirga marina]|uniref:TolC family protein n=1 Tax=Carboxylicivirga marina TaxID=2800988 RepID=A0ABS1HPV8_9BACT|nr:TolC family protein [Carboxylicivirga marina]MBK3519702.1 TolC family protein [Carboxylicivirga marina]
MKLAAISVLCLLSAIITAQTSIPQLLDSIEKNNYTLKSLRAQTDATIVGNNIGLNPANPQVEYIYQWGDTEQIGNKQEFHVRQSFDFPTAYRYRKQMTNSLNEKAERDYLNAYNVVMLDAQFYILKLIYQNAMLEEYAVRLEHAKQMAEAFHIKFDEGDANMLERNKADINLLNAQNALARLESEQALLLQQLQGINGGQILRFSMEGWPDAIMPLDFEQWFKENSDIIPEIQSRQKELSASRYNEKLSKAMSLPKLTGGYSSESGTVDKFRGVNVGLSIPLWENKNTVKQAKLNSIAKENELADAQLQLYHGLKALYGRASNMQAVATQYRNSLMALSNTDLLLVALENGQITILEYMMELSIYYEAIENALNAELEFQLNLAQMKAFQIN